MTSVYYNATFNFLEELAVFKIKLINYTKFYNIHFTVCGEYKEGCC